MNKEPITIYVKRGSPGAGESGNVSASFETTGGGVATPKDGQINAKSNSAVNAVVISSAKRAINYGVSNYGNLTGDYLAESQIQSIIEVGALTLMATQFPIGTFAAIGTVATKLADNHIQLQKKRLEVEFIKQRTSMMEFSGGRL